MAIDLDPYDAVLLDLDGTVYHEDQVLPGAAQLVNRLQSQRRRFACLSNSTSSPGRIRRRLLTMGMQLDEAQIYTAAAAAADYVIENFSHPRKVFNLATDGLADLLQKHVAWVQTPPCDVVVAGTPNVDWASEDRQRMALECLRAGAKLVGICADRVYPSPRGIEFGSGALCAMLSYASGVRPVFTGKPERVFFAELCLRVGVNPGRCILIGDNPESDIAGAKAVGMKTVLTLTGVVRPEDVSSLPEAQRPDWVVADLSQV